MKIFLTKEEAYWIASIVCLGKKRLEAGAMLALTIAPIGGGTADVTECNAPEEVVVKE